MTYLGRCEELGREVFSISGPVASRPPDLTGLPAGHFAAFVAWDTSGADPVDLEAFCDCLLKRGCVYFCAWGPDCERLHDVFDAAGVDVNPVVMTTWHSDESLEEALEFFISSSHPDAGYSDTTRSAIAISIGNRDWEEIIRQTLTKRFGNPERKP